MMLMVMLIDAATGVGDDDVCLDDDKPRLEIRAITRRKDLT